MEKPKAERKNLLKTIGFGCGFWFLAAALLQDFLIASAISLACTAVFAMWLFGSKKRKERKKARLVEKHLPFALLSISSELGYNPDFEKVLETAARQKHGLFSEGLRKALQEVKSSGASIQEALQHFSESFKSTQLKRALSQIIACFEQGNPKANSQNLKKLALELLQRQKIESKEFTAKLAVFSLMFISLSAVLPALFNAFVIVGSSFLELEFTALQVFLIGAVGFPLLNASLVFLIIQSTPEFLKGG